MQYTVKVGYDPNEKLYFVLASDIPGLNIEAETFELFVEIVKDAAPDLLSGPFDGTIRFEREIALTAA